MMNDVKDGLAQVLKGVLVLVGPMSEQSTQAIIEFELAIELLLLGLGAQFESGKVLARESSLSW
jgi:hypothetical protein